MGPRGPHDARWLAPVSGSGKHRVVPLDVAVGCSRLGTLVGASLHDWRRLMGAIGAGGAINPRARASRVPLELLRRQSVSNVIECKREVHPHGQRALSRRTVSRRARRPSSGWRTVLRWGRRRRPLLAPNIDSEIVMVRGGFRASGLGEVPARSASRSYGPRWRCWPCSDPATVVDARGRSQLHGFPRGSQVPSAPSSTRTRARRRATWHYLEAASNPREGLHRRPMTCSRVGGGGLHRLNDGTPGGSNSRPPSRQCVLCRE